MNLNNKHFSSTAVLLFAQSDKVESALKPIASSKRQNDLLWHKLNQKVLQTVRKTKLPYFISDESTQEGASFGDKLSHAIELVFNQGFKKVIVIGNDSPGLTSKIITEANEELQNQNWVFGPDFNGGTYLIGVSKANYDKSLFSQIDWHTNQVLEQLKALSFEGYKALSLLSDFNTLSDFNNLLKGFSFYSSFINSLCSLLFYQHSLNTFFNEQYTYNVLGFNFNKGSPVMV